MNHGFKKIAFKTTVLFLVGYCVYIAIEVTYRNVSYPLMGVCGGIALLLIDKINNRISWDTDIIIQGILGSCLLTSMELVIGEIAIHTGYLPIMWDYSNMFCNYDGVICLPFSVIWVCLSIAAVILADAINYYVFREEPTPYYVLLGKRIFEMPTIHTLLQ